MKTVVEPLNRLITATVPFEGAPSLGVSFFRVLFKASSFEGALFRRRRAHIEEESSQVPPFSPPLIQAIFHFSAAQLSTSQSSYSPRSFIHCLLLNPPPSPVPNPCGQTFSSRLSSSARRPIFVGDFGVQGFQLLRCRVAVVVLLSVEDSPKRRNPYQSHHHHLPFHSALLLASPEAKVGSGMLLASPFFCPSSLCRCFFALHRWSLPLLQSSMWVVTASPLLAVSFLLLTSSSFFAVAPSRLPASLVVAASLLRTVSHCRRFSVSR
ncbi:uncharacterized protein DS421_6g182210 [Arachis hypogaea]|nr:uncharacterized protein DS421_6g182210 [Arachis hypogaea]